MHGEQQLATRPNARAIAEAYRQSVADIEKASAMLVAASERVRVVLNGDPHLIYWRHYCPTEPRRTIDELRTATWRFLAERLELPRVMSLKRWKELSRDIEEGAMPEITEQALADMVASTVSSLDDLMGSAVEEVYELLRPRQSLHKTNKEARGAIGSKVILLGWVTRDTPSLFDVQYHQIDRIRAVDRVFRLLDGKGVTGETWRGELGDAIRASTTGSGQTTYFDWKAYRNGNLHLTFRRPDLVAELNRIAGERLMAAKESEP